MQSLWRIQIIVDVVLPKNVLSLSSQTNIHEYYNQYCAHRYSNLV